MLSNLGMMLGTAALSIFGGATPPDFQEESSMLLNLNDFMYEVMAVPTGSEFLNIMHGQIKALSPFAKEISEQFAENFAQIESDYLQYKTAPTASQAENLWKSLQALTVNADILKQYNGSRAMLQALKNFQQEMSIDPTNFTNESLWQLVGQVDFMSEFIMDIDDDIKDQFEKDFDLFSDYFNNFLNLTSELNQKQVLESVEKILLDLPRT
ncbi:MAG TPA: hypothetical protein VLG49_08150 [Rhabdochlamydiaceae bacterium]|nr:hypothetical protein [Rhabdochlamydiaceae bacterium]